MTLSRSHQWNNLDSLKLRLPPLPQTLPQVLKLLHEPEGVDVEDMADVARRDPGVAAGLLRHINSAYYGLRRSISSVERAIRMMGPTSAAGTVIGLSMLRMNELMEGPAGPCFTRLVRHSEGVALLTRHLLEELPLDEQPRTNGRARGTANGGPESDGFTEGLLHDLGKLVLVYNYPERAVALYEDRMFGNYFADTDERVLEQLVFGHDHTEAGAYAATEMNFPPSLVSIMRHHHDPDKATLKGDAERRFRAVCAADLATKAMGTAFQGVSATNEAIDWETCAEHPIWSHWHTNSAADDRPEGLVEDLRAKRRDMILFTDFFLDGPDAWVKAHSVA